MLFSIERASDRSYKPITQPCNSAFQKDGKWFVEIFALSQLIKIIQEVGYDIIISEENITIWDDYVD